MARMEMSKARVVIHDAWRRLLPLGTFKNLEVVDIYDVTEVQVAEEVDQVENLV